VVQKPLFEQIPSCKVYNEIGFETYFAKRLRQNFSIVVDKDQFHAVRFYSHCDVHPVPCQYGYVTVAWISFRNLLFVLGTF
jgi:hypothetical protein